MRIAHSDIYRRGLRNSRSRGQDGETFETIHFFRGGGIKKKYRPAGNLDPQGYRLSQLIHRVCRVYEFTIYQTFSYFFLNLSLFASEGVLVPHAFSKPSS